MITLEKLIQDSFVYQGNTLERAFPFEYLLGRDTNGEVLGYAKLDLLQNHLLELKGSSELQMDLRKLAIYLFEEMGQETMLDYSGGLPVRVSLDVQR